MKTKYCYILCILMLASIVSISCEEDDRDLDFIETVAEPTNLALLVQLTQDNSGIVTFTPSGESVSLFRLNYGDGSEVEEIQPGSVTTHTYPEGNYSVEVTGVNVLGETTTFVQELVVSFLPPENLEINVSPVAGDAFSINVSATADLAVGFEVYFGDVPNETPTPLMVGETITHTYPAVGVYTLRVVALAGGSATIEDTVEVVIENPILLPIDFESTTLDYTFIDFGGATTTVVSNPDPSGANTSANVAQFVKEPGAEVFAGTVIELGGPIDFSTLQGFSLKSYSPQAGLTVKMKIENAEDGSIAAEIDAVTTAVDAWETLNFDFSGIDTTQEYSKVIVFFDFGNPGTGTTFYFDDIEQSSGTANDQIILPIDFESTTINYSFIDFGGATTTVIANPDPSGENTSANVAEFFKEVGAEVFAGTVIELEGPIDFSALQGFSLKSYSPQAGLIVKLKIENAIDGSISAEIDAVTTVADAWETINFDFSGTDFSQEYSKVVVFFDFGNTGAGTTFYFDDITLSNGTGSDGVSLPVDFESTELTYSIFGFEGADSALEANPDPSGINTSMMVVRTEKTVGAQFFAGTIVELDTPIDFSTSEVVKIKTYSPKDNIPVRLKLESADGSQFVELDTNTTQMNQWEELTWDFTGTTDNNTYTKIVIFFEFVVDLPGDGTTYYFDDIELAN